MFRTSTADFFTKPQRPSVNLRNAPNPIYKFKALRRFDKLRVSV
jgi:hypothetical protein